MRLALVLVAALLLAAPAAASGPPAKGLPFSFAAPKSGHAKVYGLVVTVKLPA